MNSLSTIEEIRNRKLPYRMHLCEVASLLRLYKGIDFSDEDVVSFWKYPSTPISAGRIRKRITILNIKKFIYKRTNQIQHPHGWNPDFLMGLIQWGKLRQNAYRFPSLIWCCNNDLKQIIKSSPFSGKIKFTEKDNSVQRWSNVPALCFNYSKDSIDFMAGVLATGLPSEIKGKYIVKYNPSIEKYIREWHIPIEYRKRSWVFISPLWPALLSQWMPDFIKSKWNILKKSRESEEYAAILWKIYTGKDAVVGKIPYLLSRRTMFYRFKSVKKIEELWINNRLVELDGRFAKVVQEWAKISV